MHKIGFIATMLMLAGMCPALAQSAKHPAFGHQSAASIVNQTITHPLTETDSLLVKQLFFSALQQKLAKNNMLAADLFTRILIINPNCDAALYELAQLKLQDNDIINARLLMEKVVRLNTTNNYYWLSLAGIYQKLSDWPHLESTLSQLIQLDPDNADYAFDRANALLLQKKYDDALLVYNQLEQQNGFDENIALNRQKLYLQTGKVNLAIADMQRLIEQHPYDSRYYLLLSDIYKNNNDQNNALSTLLKAQSLNANSGRVHLALAAVYHNLHQNEACFLQLKLACAIPQLSIDQKLQAISQYMPKQLLGGQPSNLAQLCRIIAQAHPNSAKAYSIYGEVLASCDSADKAKAAFKKAIQLDNQFYDVWEQLVRLELTGGQLSQAAQDAQQALALFPNQVGMNYLAGVTYLQQKQYQKAIEYLQNVTEMETRDKGMLSQAYSGLGDCYHALGDVKHYDEAYQHAIDWNADNVYALNNFAYYLSLRKADLDKAEAFAHRAVELEPNNASFVDTYAWVLFRVQKYAEAKVWINKAISLSKTASAVQQEHLGDILYYLGDVPGAIQAWKKARLLGGAPALLDRKINEKKYFE